MNMTTSTRHVGGITVVDIGGRIILGKESASVRDMIHDLLSKGHKQILLNLGAVDFIDSWASVPWSMPSRPCANRGGELKLFNLQEKVAHVMQITKLYTVLDILNDETAAVKTFSQATSRV